ncbi:uncharacterized protein JCM10292_002578 [Rhodotorula paludigena]|uniref:uncharacterized protein n=1 Tax=Rhodotorula paludigena TaxID=86838 RepID=UPI00317B4934
MDRTLHSLTRHYPRRDEAVAQALAVLEAYPGLLNPVQEDFTYDDGRVDLLLSLTGVLPVPIGPNTYHCPLAFWLPIDFPAKPPIVYVQPSETLAVRKGKHVDASGRVAVPYLDNWDRKAEGCSLANLINELIPVFSARYPVTSVQAKPRAPPPAQAPAASSSSSTAAPPPRPPPPATSSSTSSGSALPPRPPLPPGVGTSASPRPGSGSFEPPGRPLSAASGTGAAGLPPRPPLPPGVSGSPAPPPVPRGLPGAFSQPPGPPPAYPAQSPQPPLPPPHRAATLGYGAPPATQLSQHQMPHHNGSPVPATPHSPPSQPAGPPAPPVSPPQLMPGHPASHAQPRPPHPPAPSPYPPQMAPPQHARPMMPRPPSPSASTVRSASPAQQPARSHAREPEHYRQSSIDSQRTYQSPPAPPQPRMPQQQPERSYSPALSVADSYASYVPAQPPPPAPRCAPAQEHARRTSHGSVDSYHSQPPAPQHAPHRSSPSARGPSARQTYAYSESESGYAPSPAPASEIGSYMSSPPPSHAHRAHRGPRAPGPPSEYSAAGEYGSYLPSPTVTTLEEEAYGSHLSTSTSQSGYDGLQHQHEPVVPHQQTRSLPQRSATASYQPRPPRAPQDERAHEYDEEAFEPVIEARRAPQPQQHHQQLPMPQRQGSLESHYSAASSFAPPSVAPYGSPYAAPPAPPSIASYASASAPHAHPYANGSAAPLAPPVPVVPAPAPAAPRTARKTKPKLTAHAPAPLNILDLADDELASHTGTSPSSASTVSAGAAGAPPPVPPNPALLALRTRVHSKLSSALASLAGSVEHELQQLDLLRVDLEKAQPAIEDEMARLEAVRSVCEGVRARYAEVVDKAEGRMREYEARGEGVEVDEIVCGSTVVYVQLLDLVAEDAALEDTIYALGRGLNSGGVANIDLDRFLKRVRILAKEQFAVRATINKILLGLAARRERNTTGGSRTNGVASPARAGTPDVAA